MEAVIGRASEEKKKQDEELSKAKEKKAELEGQIQALKKEM